MQRERRSPATQKFTVTDFNKSGPKEANMQPNNAARRQTIPPRSIERPAHTVRNSSCCQWQPERNERPTHKEGDLHTHLRYMNVALLSRCIKG
eukprot:3502622-Amphidinium_carterae.1